MQVLLEDTLMYVNTYWGHVERVLKINATCH